MKGRLKKFGDRDRGAGPWAIDIAVASICVKYLNLMTNSRKLRRQYFLGPYLSQKGIFRGPLKVGCPVLQPIYLCVKTAPKG